MAKEDIVAHERIDALSKRRGSVSSLPTDRVKWNLKQGALSTSARERTRARIVAGAKRVKI